MTAVLRPRSPHRRHAKRARHGHSQTAESRRRLLTAHVQRGETGVGYGWFVTRTPRGTSAVWTRGYESVGHGAVFATYPDERAVIVVTSNSGERSAGRPVSHAIADELATLIFER